MFPINDLFSQLDNACLATFGIPATLFPQSGGEVEIVGAFLPPALVEDIFPGQGASAIRFFVRLSEITPTPQHGDQLEINEVPYDVFEIEADNVGGGVLKLRKRA